ncbi:MAG: beta-L-arabinofuranosidase domain-containing protein [Terriglobia bacterium]
MPNSTAKTALIIVTLFTFLTAPVAARTADVQDSATVKAPLLPAGARLRELPLTAVEIEDAFWSPRLEVNRTRTLDHVYKELELTGCIRNFDIAGGKAQGKFGGPWWADSDVYKWIEGASYILALHPNAQLESKVDELIRKIAAAQQKDGYLDTYVLLRLPDLKWKSLAFNHEMFCAGSLFEAAVAHNQATGKRSLLEIALRLADHLDSTFGPGKQAGIPGHEEVELALVRLYRLTGEKRYLRLAEYFVNSRGQKPSIFERQYEQLPERQVDLLGHPMSIKDFYRRFFLVNPSKFDTSYSQDQLPAREQRVAVGHAVRAMYFYSGMADLVYETGDAGLWEALESLHDSVTDHRMYVTGGIGPSERNEGFTADYDLPNEDAYQETCASAGMVFWNYRMLKLTGDARYADVMELSLYNALAAGVSLTGDTFCYVTPLASRGDFKRDPWFGVPCCPTTVARFLPALGRYIYSESPDGLWVNLFIAGQANANVAGEKVTLRQSGNYPWDGKIKFTIGVEAPQDFVLRVRIPGWAARADFEVNGKKFSPRVVNGYAEIRRPWSNGATVELTLPMEVQRLEANPQVVYDHGKSAVRRGPLIYCLEQADQTAPLDEIILPLGAQLESQNMPDLLGGITVVKGQGLLRPLDDWKSVLYQRARTANTQPLRVTAVPYCVWGNRGLGKMAVWLDTTP